MIVVHRAENPPPKGEDCEEAGLSLVEMLITLAVMGMAAVLLTAGIERVALGMDMANRADNRLDGIASAQALLRQRLATIVPVGDPETGGAALDFDGQAESIDFYGQMPDRAAPDALQHYRLQRSRAGDLVLLRVSTLDRRVDPRSRTSQGWTPLALVPGITGIAIRYLGQNPQLAEQHAVWQAGWSHRAGLPMLVRISVEFSDGDRRQWPDLVVHPRAATPEPCPRDPITGGCTPPASLSG